MVYNLYRVGRDWYAQYRCSLGDVAIFGPYESRKDAINSLIADQVAVAPHLLTKL